MIHPYCANLDGDEAKAASSGGCTVVARRTKDGRTTWHASIRGIVFGEGVAPDIDKAEVVAVKAMVQECRWRAKRLAESADEFEAYLKELEGSG